MSFFFEAVENPVRIIKEIANFVKQHPQDDFRFHRENRFLASSTFVENNLDTPEKISAHELLEWMALQERLETSLKRAASLGEKWGYQYFALKTDLDISKGLKIGGQWETEGFRLKLLTNHRVWENITASQETAKDLEKTWHERCQTLLDTSNHAQNWTFSKTPTPNHPLKADTLDQAQKIHHALTSALPYDKTTQNMPLRVAYTGPLQKPIYKEATAQTIALLNAMEQQTQRAAQKGSYKITVHHNSQHAPSKPEISINKESNIYAPLFESMIQITEFILKLPCLRDINVDVFFTSAFNSDTNAHIVNLTINTLNTKDIKREMQASLLNETWECFQTEWPAKLSTLASLEPSDRLWCTQVGKFFTSQILVIAANEENAQLVSQTLLNRTSATSAVIYEC